MSFGLSVGDIKLAWELASFLHEKCFTKASRADVQYLRFGREIESLADTLRQLEAVIKHANKQRPRRPWRHHDEESRDALHPLSQATGDFQTTLLECQKLLEDHDRFQKDSAGFVDNVKWHIGTQKDVEILRERVHFHSTKLLIILRPFEMNLLLDIQRDLQDLRREVAEIKGLLVTVLANGTLTDDRSSICQDSRFPEIPHGTIQRFLNAATEGAPKASYDVANMPLTEAFDALVYHFARSTVEFNPGVDPSLKVPDETQYVNLLKSSWVLEKLERSSHFKDTKPTSLWASYFLELKSDLVREYKRFEAGHLIAPSQDAVSRLPDECFSIWVIEAPPLSPPDLVEQRPLEYQILELTLPENFGTRRTFLNVFRRSAIEFRLVNTTKDLSNPDYHQEKEFIVNTDATQVIPAYAMAEAGVSNNNLLLSSTHVQDLRWQYLGSPEDVVSLQHALIGYRVHHKMDNVSWSINGSSKSDKSGQGRLQLWQRQNLTSARDELDRTPTQSPTSTKSPSGTIKSFEKSPTFSTTFSSTTTMLSGNSTSSVITGSRGNGTAIVLPEPPVLLIFTKHEEKYAFLHVELHPHIFINPERCDCRSSKRECKTVVIESKQKIFNVRRLCAQQSSGKGLYTWDLARFRMPRHPEYHNVEVLPKVKYITLEFPTVKEKDEYCWEVKLLERVRLLEHNMYHDLLNIKRLRSGKPGRNKKLI